MMTEGKEVWTKRSRNIISRKAGVGTGAPYSPMRKAKEKGKCYIRTTDKVGQARAELTRTTGWGITNPI